MGKISKMPICKAWIAALSALLLTAGAAAAASDDAKYKAAYKEDGKYFTEDDTPTYNIAEDGTVDWPTYSGFRRYHSDCHVCHGPDGEGSTYAPALKTSVLNLDYAEFLDIVASGRKKETAGNTSVMPSFGENPNVMCYVADIFVYLRARGTEAIGRGRPSKKEAKDAVIREEENACLGL